MERIERLRAILKREFGITTDRELLDALESMEELDTSIFTAPIGGRRDEKTA